MPTILNAVQTFLDHEHAVMFSDAAKKEIVSQVVESVTSRYAELVSDLVACEEDGGQLESEVSRRKIEQCWGRKRGKDLSAVAIRRQRVCGANGKVWHRAEGVGGVSGS